MTHQRKTIAKIERAKNSTNGNPSFWITFTDYDRIKTAADASFGYEVGNAGMREGSDVDVFVGGRGTITGMAPAREVSS